MIQYKRIGDMLLEAGLINAEQLDLAMKTKLGSNLRFGEILTAMGLVSEDQVTECLANQYGYRVADLSHVEPEPEAIAVVPSITALSGLVLPVKVTSERFYCIIADPLDIPMTDSLFRLAGRPVEFSLAAPTVLFEAILKAYRLGRHAKDIDGIPFVYAGSNETSAIPKNLLLPPRKRRPIKIDPQDDRSALLDALGSIQGLEVRP